MDIDETACLIEFKFCEERKKLLRSIASSAFNMPKLLSIFEYFRKMQNIILLLAFEESDTLLIPMIVIVYFPNGVINRFKVQVQSIFLSRCRFRFHQSFPLFSEFRKKKGYCQYVGWTGSYLKCLSRNLF